MFRSGCVSPHLSFEGRPTGALYGTLKAIHALRTKVSPRMIFCWDHGVPVLGTEKPRNWRDKAIHGYKAGRKHDPEIIRAVLVQAPEIFAALQLLGYCSVSVHGLEADDVIGILAHELPCDIRIFSNDKDFYQLLNHRIQVLAPKQHNSEYRTVTAADVEQMFEVPVKRWPEYLALGGDTADNLNPAPGSRLFGPKTAARLLASGVNLNKHPSKQPLEFWEKYGVYWHRIQEAYFAARIPTCWEDPRIADCVKKAGGKPEYHTDQLNKDQEKRLKEFTEFLSGYNMLSLLSVRHDFFSVKNGAASSCSNPSQTSHSRPKPKPKPLI
jgi:5'-3' exonuclease